METPLDQSKNERKAAANPTKAFFVRMLTRDITLEDCILDLIDNSVDGAWRTIGEPPTSIEEGLELAKFNIHIVATRERFSIQDNCGGMTYDEAAYHAFSFGRNNEAESDDYSIGVYGIGMKRAVFKLGDEINIHSTYTKSDGSRDAFRVPMIVSEWLEDDTTPWGFELLDDQASEEDGVRISVSRLTESAQESFDNPAFLQGLRRTIGRDYSLHLARGLRIQLNGEQIGGWQIELSQSEDFRPMRDSYQDSVDGHDVFVEIIGGMAAPPPDDNEPNEDGDGDRRFGWYVACNGRIVLAADKSAVSGWGDEGWPQWHRQYSGFIGIALFTSRNAAALPLTTTKRSVDTTSPVFRRARRPHMRDLTRKWIDYTNQRKGALEEARSKEANAKPVSISAVEKRESPLLPALAPRKREPMAHVNYSVPKSRLRELAKALGSVNMSQRDVGLKSFDYTYTDHVGED